MSHAVITGMILIAICCVLLATQPKPSRGTRRRQTRPSRRMSRDDGPAPRHELPAAYRQSLAHHPNVTHRNHWPRPDLDRTFGQTSDALPPELSVWPIHAPWPR